MKRPNITPGKWKKRRKNGSIIICREDPQAVGIPLDVCRVWQSSFTEANARAIVSVPKLLAALERCLPDDVEDDGTLHDGKVAGEISMGDMRAIKEVAIV